MRRTAGIGGADYHQSVPERDPLQHATAYGLVEQRRPDRHPLQIVQCLQYALGPYRLNPEYLRGDGRSVGTLQLRENGAAPRSACRGRLDPGRIPGRWCFETGMIVCSSNERIRLFREVLFR